MQLHHLRAFTVPLLLTVSLTTARPALADPRASFGPHSSNNNKLSDVLDVLEKAPMAGDTSATANDDSSAIDVSKILRQSGAPAVTDPEAVARLFAAALGVPETSRFFPRIKSRVLENLRHKSDNGRIANADLADEQGQVPRVLQVTAHFRGSQGIKFPTEEEMDIYPPFTAQQVEAALKTSQTSTEESVAMQPDLMELPACEKNTTERDDSGDQGLKSNDLVFDMLFIAPGQMPSNPDEIFGKETSVRVYDPKNDPEYALAIRSMGVQCLPYRIRATNQFRFRDFGAAALKNYDNDPSGSGVLISGKGRAKR